MQYTVRNIAQGTIYKVRVHCSINKTVRMNNVLCSERSTVYIDDLERRRSLSKMYIFCTDSSCQNWFPDFLLVKQNSFTTAYPMNQQNKPVLMLWIYS